MLTADAVEVYELLKPKVGEQEAKSLLRFIEDRTIHLVRDEIAKGLATRADITDLKEDIAELKGDIAKVEMFTKADIAEIRTEMATKADIAELREDIARLEMATKADIARLEMTTKADIARLEKKALAAEWRTRIYLMAIGALILLTNPKVLDLLGKLMGLVP